MTISVKCPTCGRPVEWSADSTHRPFCSERCRLVDLGAWFSEKHAIPGESPADAHEPNPRAEDP